MSVVQTVKPSADRYGRPVAPRTTLAGPDTDAAADDNGTAWIRIAEGIKSILGPINPGGIFGGTHVLGEGLDQALETLRRVYNEGRVSGDQLVLVRLEFTDGGQRRSEGGRRDDVRRALESMGAEMADAGGRVHWDVRVPIKVLGAICPAPGQCLQWVRGMALHEKARTQIMQLIAAYNAQATGAPLPPAEVLDLGTGIGTPKGTGSSALATVGKLAGSLALGLAIFSGINFKDRPKKTKAKP